MIPSMAFILSLVLPIFFGVTQLSATETVIVNKAFHGREIKVRTGGLIRIDLEELGAAGYAWATKDLDKEHFEVVSVHTGSNSPAGDVTGAPVVRTWLIRAIRPGKAELTLIYYRPWEGEEKAADRFVLTVRIL